MPVRGGIIPARAGFTASAGGRSASAAVAGSSPLARGLQLADGGFVALLGIIPARAGFTHPRQWKPCWSEDHPRSRGVYDE